MYSYIVFFLSCVRMYLYSLVNLYILLFIKFIQNNNKDILYFNFQIEKQKIKRN